MFKTIAAYCLGLLCASAGQAQVSGAAPTTSSEMCLLARIATSVRIVCHEAQAGMMLEGAMPVRLWLPDFGGPDARDYFLEPATLGPEVKDYVFARLTKALEYCAKDEDCQKVGREQRKAAAEGCTEPPKVYQPKVVFRYNGNESPLYPSGYVFLCQNADRMLMIWLGPGSMTLKLGGVPGTSDTDGFDIAVFPLPD